MNELEGIQNAVTDAIAEAYDLQQTGGYVITQRMVSRFGNDCALSFHCVRESHEAPERNQFIRLGHDHFESGLPVACLD